MTLDPSSEIRPADRYFTSREVANLLQVTASSVVKWINQGLLEAFRTPGGHRRVTATELVRFSLHHGMPVPDALRDLAISKVLIIDDEPRFLRAIQRTFNPYPTEFHLEAADNGVDGLMLLGSLKPDVLILDVRMPGLDGFDVLKRIKANPNAKALTVIVMSGHLDAATEARCMKLGATVCLEKPFNASRLLEFLRELRKPRHAWSR